MLCRVFLVGKKNDYNESWQAIKKLFSRMADSRNTSLPLFRGWVPLDEVRLQSLWGGRCDATNGRKPSVFWGWHHSWKLASQETNKRMGCYVERRAQIYPILARKRFKKHYGNSFCIWNVRKRSLAFAWFFVVSFAFLRSHVLWRNAFVICSCWHGS